MLIKRIIISFIGINILALGMAFLMAVEFALDSFDSLAYFIQQAFGISSLGNAIFVLHVGFWLILILALREKGAITENIISIASVFLITRIIDLYINHFQIAISNLMVAILIFGIGFLIVNFGLYLIAITDLFIPPYDKLVVHLSQKLKFEIGKMRQITDISIIVFLFVMSLITNNLVLLSIGTVFFGFGTGQNIKMYERLFNKYYENL